MGQGQRQYLRRPGINVTDLSLFKNFPFGGEGSRYLQLRFETFNLFNHPQFDNFNTGLTYTVASNFSDYAANQQASSVSIRNLRGGQTFAATGPLGRGVGEFNGQPGFVNGFRVIQLAAKIYSQRVQCPAACCARIGG